MITAPSVSRQVVPPPLIYLWRRPTLEPTGAPAQDRDPVGDGGTYQEPLLDPRTIIKQTLNFLHPAGAVFELCGIGPKPLKSPMWEGFAAGRKPVVAGWFRDPGRATQLAAQIQATGVYVTLNPCLPALLSRANERLVAGVGRTKDAEIQHIRNLLIDVDPIRPEGISSTDAEHEGALEMVQVIQADLEREGWPNPLVGDSGNGGHLTYPLDLPPDEESVALLKAVLAGLARRYADHLTRLNLEIDQAVFNPARLTKLYGTMTRKGDNTPDRPHRLARIIFLPKARQPVPVELLERIAQEAGAEEAHKTNAHRQADGIFDVKGYLTRYGKEVVNVKPHGEAVLYCLQECIFDSTHTDNDAAIGQAADGTLFYQCFHRSCKGRTWAEARAKISGQNKLTEFIIGAAHSKNFTRPVPGGVCRACLGAGGQQGQREGESCAHGHGRVPGRPAGTGTSGHQAIPPDHGGGIGGLQ